MIIEFKGQNYIFEIGLNVLMCLQQLTNYSVETSLPILVKMGLEKYQPQISLDEVKEMLLDSQIRTTLNCLLTQNALSQVELEELYMKAVGEIGIQPSEFYHMTVADIELAYEGYLRKKEIEANLQVTSINWAKSQSPELIRITEEREYEIGSLKERNEVFKNLKIEV